MVLQRLPSLYPMPSHAGLPPGHFLSLPPSYSQPSAQFSSGVPSTSAHTSGGLAPNIASLAGADFDVDVRTGFLPATLNVERLPSEWEIWEAALDAARGNGVVGETSLRIGGGRDRDQLWRSGIESMPVLDTLGLQVSLPYLRRAHLVLTFLLHFYAHTSSSTSTSRATPLPIPQPLSIPLLSVSPLLGLPPVVTYSDTVLYNFLPANVSSELVLPSNPPAKCIVSFTNTRSEEQFYVISALCEIAGAEALRLMRQSLDELFLGDAKAIKRLTVYLRKLAAQIDRIGDITLSMIHEVDPEDFYHLIRPWFRGGDADGPQSAGWAFLGCEDETSESAAENMSSSSYSSPSGTSTRGRLFSGPSAGQSSLIHAIDIFLTVDHTHHDDDVSLSPSSEGSPGQPPSGAMPAQTPPSPSLSESPIPSIVLDATSISTKSTKGPQLPPRPNEATFVQRMLQYMPVQHRTFLLHLSTHPSSLRALVLDHAITNPRLAEAYDGALEALKGFREKHMRVVSIFIIQQARRRPSERVRKLLGQVDEEKEEKEGHVDIKELRGTGGSPLFKFLKRCRDSTTRVMVRKAAGPSFDLA